MREIKFRAWEKNRKEMLEVLGIFFDVGTIKHKLLKIKGNTNPFNDGYPNTNFGDIELMQYIGLKDKKGKEIYEGDILLITDYWTEPIMDGCGPKEATNHLAPVDFKDGSFGVFINAPADIYARKGFWSFPEIQWDIGDTTTDMEIVGNIYENPELLEEK